jgi:Holliday junction resolvasome RuvABC endonuclease subunit
MITLGLDPSLTNLGWCIHDSSAEGSARVVGRGLISTPASAIFVQRYMTHREGVGRILDEHPEIEAVGVEAPVFGEQWSPGAYALYIMVNEAIYTRRKDVVYFDPGTVKMLAKGDPKIRGKMFKTDMVQAARADTGITGRFDHNEADAYHVARFAARFWVFLQQVEKTPREDAKKGPRLEIVRAASDILQLSPAEAQAFAKIHTFSKGDRAGQTVWQGAAFKEGKRFFRFSELPKD